jgi:hypothetical protein
MISGVHRNSFSGWRGLGQEFFSEEGGFNKFS